MSDAIIQIGGDVVEVDIVGAPGPRGLASGPLGAESVTDEEINTSAAGAILEKLGGVGYEGNGAIGVFGGTTSGLGLGRDDAGLFIVSPETGAAGQRHALFLFRQLHNDDESAIVGIHTIDGSDVQIWTMFSALEDHNDDPAEFCGYTGWHGVSYAGDNIPLVIYYDNRVEVCTGTIGSPPIFDRGLTEPGVFHNFQNTYLQGWTVLGLHAQSVHTGSNLVLEGNGRGFFGTVDGTTYESTIGVLFGASGDGTRGLFQGHSFAGGGALVGLDINSSDLKFFNTAKPTLPADATDLATAQALANATKAALINYGLAA